MAELAAFLSIGVLGAFVLAVIAWATLQGPFAKLRAQQADLPDGRGRARRAPGLIPHDKNVGQ